jgi:predicted O-methyltransferase YrrM
MKQLLSNIIKRMVKADNEHKDSLAFPPGHYYSPLVSLSDIKKRENEIWKGLNMNSVNGVELYADEQLLLVKELTKYYSEIPFEDNKKQNLRYYFDNSYYSYTDSIILYSVMRHFKPKKIIEVGSGFSSAVMLDTRQLFFEDRLQLTFIEPFPDRLYTLITENDKTNSTIIVDDLQNIDVSYFEQLDSNDILFIDSSHVSKTGSDVNYILFDILPKLKPGTLIHFHDVFYPFEYPKDWVLSGRNWNEDYLLRAFLMYNKEFRVKIFSHFLHIHYKEVFSGMPLCYKNPGGNLWIQKIGQ